MKVDKSPYSLAWRHRPEVSREGALLRYRFDDGCVGYADCFCWPEFGDDPLETQLELLSKGKVTPLTKRSGVYARLDADARRKKVNLFANVKIPPSHHLVSSISKEGPLVNATHFKVKMGDSLIEETLLLKVAFISNPKAKFRLDFNGKVDRTTFEGFMRDVKAYHHQIDFIEDPFPFDTQAWKEVQAAFGVPLAIDRGASRALGKGDVAAVVVVKPAKHDESYFRGGEQRVTITSYLDHPIGQLSAAYFAAKMGVVEPCGLTSHTAYVDNIYSKRLKIVNHVLTPPLKGTGFGFDDLLEKEPWEAL